MKFFYSLFAVMLALLPLAGCGVDRVQAQAADTHLAAVLAQMDRASAQFKNARADFSQEYYERVSKDTTNENGSIYFERHGAVTQMGAVTVDPKTKANNKVLEFKDGMLQIFDIPDDQIRLVKAGSNQGQVETFLTLGFGGSGKALAQSWDITDQGAETLTDGAQAIKTEKLNLVSKDPAVRNNFTQVTVWIDPVRGVSLKQVFETPSHDKRTTTYSHIKVNGSIDTGFFAIKKGKKTTVVGP
jgi:outer membrane lipoprotein-sorting protein